VGLSTSYQYVKIELAHLFSKYKSKFSGLRLQRPLQPNNGAVKKVRSWNMIFGSGCGVPTTSSPSASALRDVSELTTYLASDHVRQFDDHLLSWWHDHKRAYHVLCILVKDIMIVHVSTRFGVSF
jgi:hypothetical protein